MAHTSDPSTQEVEAGLSEIQSQLQLLEVSLSHMKSCLKNQTNKQEGGGEEEKKEEGEEEETTKHRDRCRNTYLQSQHLERRRQMSGQCRVFQVTQRYPVLKTLSKKKKKTEKVNERNSPSQMCETQELGARLLPRLTWPHKTPTDSGSALGPRHTTPRMNFIDKKNEFSKALLLLRKLKGRWWETELQKGMPWKPQEADTMELPCRDYWGTYGRNWISFWLFWGHFY